MCKCFNKIIEKTTEYLKEDKKKSGVIGKVDFKNYGFSFGENGGIITYQPVEYEMTNLKKDGTTGATRKYTTSIYHTYCPFCGEKHLKKPTT